MGDSRWWTSAGRGWRSRPTPSWSGRCSSPAAASATSRSTARSTTWRWRARGRCACRPRSSSRRAPRWTSSAASPRLWARRRWRPGVQLVTGDTKVVDAGHGDGVYVNTAGIGLVDERVDIRPQPGRRGDVGHRQRRHRRARRRDDELPRGARVRHHVASDTRAAARAGRGDARHRRRRARAARPDPRRRRGDAERDRQDRRRRRRAGRAGAPDPAEVRDACGLLGLDPLYVANEGKLLAFVPADDADGCWPRCARTRWAPGAAVIGECVAEHPGMVVGRRRRSAAPAWSTCRSASSCRGSAE